MGDRREPSLGTSRGKGLFGLCCGEEGGCFWTRKKAGGQCMKDVLEFSEVIETGTSSYSGAL